MLNRQFKQVDVFTATPYLGNPLAVVLDAAGLSDAQMQRFAQWTNLSETTFLLPPTPEAAALGADYRVRIFTPGGELAFAGHPTLGSCHAWLQAQQQSDPSRADNGRSLLVQECGVGLVRIQRNGTRLAFGAPPLQRSEPTTAMLQAVLAALGLDTRHLLNAQLLNNGTTWLGLLIDSAEVLLGLEPNHQELKNLGQKVGVAHIEKALLASENIAMASPEAPADQAHKPRLEGTGHAPLVQLRAFAAVLGVNEDPVCGSLNASVAQWLIADGLAPGHYIATQGSCLGRHGQVHIDQDENGQIWVGGEVVTCIDGMVCL